MVLSFTPRLCKSVHFAFSQPTAPTQSYNSCFGPRSQRKGSLMKVSHESLCLPTGGVIRCRHRTNTHTELRIRGGHRSKQQRQCRPAPACARKSPPRVVHSKETRQDGRHRRRDVQPLASSTFFPCWRTVPLVSGGARYEAARMLLVLVLARAAGNLSTSPTSCLALFMPASKTHHTRRDARPPTTCASLLHTTNTDG